MSGPIGEEKLSTHVLVAGVGTAVVSACSLWPLWLVNPVTALINLLVAISFVVTAVVLGENPFHRSTACVLALTAPFWLISWWWAWPLGWQIGPVALISNVTGYLWFVFGGIALLRYPEARLATRVERWYFAVLAGWVCLGKILIATVSEPEWAELSPAAWWPTIAPNRPLHDASSPSSTSESSHWPSRCWGFCSPSCGVRAGWTVSTRCR